MDSRKPHGLSSNERIKSKKDFDELYSSGKILISGNQLIKVIYISKENTDQSVKIAAVVSRKLGSAVWRNRVKRLIKEAYRLNKQEIISFALNSNLSYRIIFSAYALSERKNKKISLSKLTPEVIELLYSIKKNS